MKRHFVVCLALLLLVVAAPKTANAQRFVYVTNFGSSSVSVIDTSSNTVAASISVGGDPYGVAITPDGSRVYVANQSSNSVSIIDTATNVVVATVAVGSGPTGVAVTPDGSNVYVTNYGSYSVPSSVSVISTASNTVVATVPVGNNPSSVVVTPDGTRAYVVNSYGSSVSVINTATDAVDTTISIAGQPYWIALTPDGSHAYVTNRSLGSVSVIDTATDTVTATINVGSVSYGVAVTPGGTQAWVTNLFSNSVSVIDTATNTVASTISSVSEPYGVAFTPDGTLAYVTDRFGTSVSVISTASGTVSSSVTAGNQPVRVAVTPSAADVVTSLADDGSPGTLRYVIANANAGDTITFSVTGTITLTQGQLGLSKNVTIHGPGAASLAISGNNVTRVFLIDSGVTVSISGVTIRNGVPNGPNPQGGGIYNAGTATITNTTFSGNSANVGGGFLNGGTATVTNSTFSGNSSGGLGGGIANNGGTLTVNSTTFSGNSGGLNYGGGMWNGSGGTATITNTTFSDNSANGGGGFVNGATATITNSTFFGNSANACGGFCNGAASSATVSNSTFFGNSGGNIRSSDGGQPGGVITVKNTLLANAPSGGNCTNAVFGTFTSGGYNLSDDASCVSFFTAIGDVNSTPAGLDPNGLKDYGGPTFTVALQSTSLAADAIPVSPTNYCTDVAGNPVTADQRGVTRPHGAACDIGAYELDRAASLPTLTSSINPSNPGQSVTFTATVSHSSGSGTPTGTVTFYDGSSGIGTAPLNGSAEATVSTSTLSSGTHAITAVYSGDSTFAASTSAALTQTVNGATTTSLSSSLNPSTYGQSVALTATVTSTEGTPTGTVTFYDGATILGSGSLNASGLATFSTGALVAGTHSITADYNGDNNFAGSTSPALLQTVNKATTSTAASSSLNPSIYGQAVMFTAKVTSSPSTPTGTVTFYDGSTTLGTGSLNASGQAIFTTSVLAVGTHSITATYGGDSNFTTSTSASLSQSIAIASTATLLTSAPNPSTQGQQVNFVASVTDQYGGSVAGTVTFKNGNNAVLGSVSITSNGTATLLSSSLGIGSHSITATYSGDANNKASVSAAITQSVVSKTATTTTLASSLNPSFVGQAVTFTATITPSAATGAVTFKQGQTVLGTGTVSSGQATFMTTSLPAGSLLITAAYTGDTQYASSTSAALTQVVNKGTTAITIGSAPNPSNVGQTVTFTATVTVISPNGGTPTGTVSFDSGNTTLGTGTLNSNGTAMFSTSTLGQGKYNVKAVYGGSTAYSGSTSTAITQLVQ